MGDTFIKGLISVISVLNLACLTGNPIYDVDVAVVVAAAASWSALTS